MSEPTKICAKCGAEKPLSEFKRHPKTGDGYANKCRACLSEEQLRKGSRINPVCHDELLGIPPRSLMEHLCYMGYRGKFEYTYTYTIEMV